MAYFNCLNSVKAGPNPLNSSNSRSWIFSSLHGCFFLLSVLHSLCTKSHTTDHTSRKPVSAGPCPSQGKSCSNLEDAPTLKVSLQRSFPTKMSLRWRHYTTWTGRSRAEAAWSWADPEHGWGTRLPWEPGDAWLGGHRLARDARSPWGLLILSNGLKKIMPCQRASGPSDRSWKCQLIELAQG